MDFFYDERDLGTGALCRRFVTGMLVACSLVVLASCASTETRDNGDRPSCVESSSVQFRPPFTRAGGYVVEIDADGKRTCTMTIADSSAVPGEYKSDKRCTDTSVLLNSITSTSELTNTTYEVPEIQGIVWTALSARGRVTVKRDGVTLLDQEVELVPQRGASCTSASASVAGGI